MNTRLESHARVQATREIIARARRLHPNDQGDADFAVLLFMWSSALNRAELECMLAGDEAESTNAWACEVETQAERVMIAAEDAEDWDYLTALERAGRIQSVIETLELLASPSDRQIRRLAKARKIVEDTAAGDVAAESRAEFLALGGDNS